MGNPHSTPARLAFRALVALMLVGSFEPLVGCNNASLPAAPTPTDNGTTLFTLAINATAGGVRVGSQMPLALSGQDVNGDPVSVSSATWTSANASVASVSAAGVVTGVAPGQTTITADTSNPPREATYKISVVAPGQPIPAAAPGLNGSNALSPTGTYGTPNPDVIPTLPPYPTTQTGLPVTIPTGMAVDPNAPSPPPGVDLLIYPQRPGVLVGGTLRLLAAQGYPGSEQPSAAIWSSSNPNVASVDAGGVVTGLAPGTVTITAVSDAYPGLAQQTTLVVSAPVPSSQVRGISITPSHVTMDVGQTFWLLAQVPTATGGNDPNIQWQVGDPSIVAVSQTGQLTALAPGQTTVTAIAVTYDQGTLSATIPVVVNNAISSGYRIKR